MVSEDEEEEEEEEEKDEGAAATLRFSGLRSDSSRFCLCSAALCWSLVLLQHLASRFGQLRGEETTCGQSAGGEQDGHGLGDAHERLEDADAQDGRQFAESIEEAEGRAPAQGKGTVQ